MSVTVLEAAVTGGIPVAPGGRPGGLVVEPGQVQYGEALLGTGTAAGWRQLVGWRDLPDAAVADSPRPQAHGAYGGDVFGGSLAVTFTFLLRGSPQAKVQALNTLEQYLPMDGVERCLAVDDGDGAWCRWARVIGRQVPQEVHYTHAPLECSVQFLCADPRRYRITERTVAVTLPQSLGGLDYASGLEYPLLYGESSSGSLLARNAGSTDTPLVATFYGPLTDPALVASRWRMAFSVNLAAGEYLTVDTLEGTALLNGTADRLYTLQPTSDPLERCVLPPGATNLSLTAPDGDGRVQVTYRDARM